MGFHCIERGGKEGGKEREKTVFVYHTDVVALTGCARAALGICASSSGAVAGLLTWQV